MWMGIGFFTVQLYFVAPHVTHSDIQPSQSLIKDNDVFPRCCALLCWIAYIVRCASFVLPSWLPGHYSLESLLGLKIFILILDPQECKSKFEKEIHQPLLPRCPSLSLHSLFALGGSIQFYKYKKGGRNGIYVLNILIALDCDTTIWEVIITVTHTKKTCRY